MSGRIVVILLLALIAAAGAAIFSYLVISQPVRVRASAVIGMIAAVTTAIIVAAVLWRRHHRVQQTSHANQIARQLHLTYREKAPRDFQKTIGPLPGIPRGGTISHLFTGAAGERHVTIFQHTYFIHTGQASVPIHHAVYSMNAPEWPEVSIIARLRFDRFLYRLGWKRGQPLDVESFNRAYRVKSSDEDFSLVLLTPEMQKLMGSRRALTWKVNPERVSIVQRGGLDFDRIATMLEHFRAFWSLVPEELNDWTPEAATKHADGGAGLLEKARQSGARNPYR